MDGKPLYRLKVCHPGAGSRHPAGTTTERDYDQSRCAVQDFLRTELMISPRVSVREDR